MANDVGTLTPQEIVEAEAQEKAQAAAPAQSIFHTLSAKELAELSVSSKGEVDPIREFRNSKDLWGNPEIVQKVADANNLLRQRGFKLADIPGFNDIGEGVSTASPRQAVKGVGEAAGAGAKGAFEFGKGVAKQGYNYLSALVGMPIAAVAGELTGQSPDFTSELGKLAQRQVAENIAGTEQAVTGLTQMGGRVASKIFGKNPAEETPEERVKALWGKVGQLDVSEEAGRGHGAFLGSEAVGKHVVKELEESGLPVRPEETAQLAAGDPVSLWAFGKLFHGVGKLTPAVPGLQQAASTAAVRGGGKMIELAGEAAGATAKGIKAAAPVVLPVTGGVTGAVKFGPAGAIGGIAAGGIAGQRVASLAGHAVRAAEGAADIGRQIAGNAPIRSAWAQLGRDTLAATPAVAGGMAQGAGLDVLTSAISNETPEETANQPLFGAAFGAIGGARLMGRHILSGQLVAPRAWGSTKVTASSGSFPALDAMHTEAMRTAPPAVQERVNAIREFAKSLTDADTFTAQDPATLRDALVKSGVSPEQADLFSQQEGVFVRNINGKRVIIALNPEAAPHESFHALQDVLGEGTNRQIDELIKQNYDMEQEGRQYAARLLGVSPEQVGNWRETILDQSGWGNAEAVERVMSEIEPSVASREAGGRADPKAVRALAEELFSREQAQDKGWRDVVPPAEQDSFVREVSDRYIARELAAENFDVLFKHTGPTLERTGILPKLAQLIGGVVDKLGGNPLAGRVSAIGEVAPKFEVLGAVKGAAKGITPRVVEPRTAATPARPVVGVPRSLEEQQDAAGQAREAAAAASDTVEAGGQKSAREILGQVAEAIAQRVGLKVNYRSAPGEPAGAITSNRPARREIIEAFRNMPEDARALWEKNFFPERVTGPTKAGGYQVMGWAPEVFAANAHKLAKALNEAGLADMSVYEIDPKTGTFKPEAWKQLYRDLSAFVENQMAGATGAGEPLIVPHNLQERGFFKPQVKPGAAPLEQGKADFINLLFNIKLPETPRVQKGRLPRNIAGQEVSEATKPGRVESPVRPRGEFTGEEAEKQGIAGRQVMEVNPLRNQIEAALTAAGKPMPSFVEAIQKINVEHIADATVAPELPEFRGNEFVLAAGFQPGKFTVEGTKGGLKEKREFVADDMASARRMAENEGMRVARVTPVREGDLLGSEALIGGQFQPARDTSKQHVAEAALRDKKTGEIFTGFAHFDALEKALELDDYKAVRRGDEDSTDVFEDGFVDDSGTFLTRDEAYKVARSAGQFTDKSEAAAFGSMNTGVPTEGALEAVSFQNSRQFQPSAKLKEEILSMDQDAMKERMGAYKSDRFGAGLTGWAMDVGASAKTQADLVPLADGKRQAATEFQTALKAGDFTAATVAANKKQFFQEALEMATGQKLDFVRKHFDPNYVPPLPGVQFQAKTKAGKLLEEEGYSFEQTGRPGTRGVVAVLDGQPVGAISSHWGKLHPLAFVDSVDVDKPHRGKGVGEALYRELMTDLKSDGVKSVQGMVVRPEPLLLREKVFGPGKTKYFLDDAPIDLATAIKAAEEYQMSGRDENGDWIVHAIEPASRISPDSQFAPKKKTPTEEELTDYSKYVAEPSTGEVTPYTMKGGNISRAWIMPDGTPAQLGSKWHHQWLSENPEVTSEYGLEVPKFSGTDETGPREAALRKGFARVTLSDSGRMTIEMRQADVPKQLGALKKLVADNIDKIDTFGIGTMNDKATGSENFEYARLLKAEDPLSAAMDLLDKVAGAKGAERGAEPTSIAQMRALPGEFQPKKKERKLRTTENFWVAPDGKIIPAPEGHEAAAADHVLPEKWMAQTEDVLDEVYSYMFDKKYVRGLVGETGELDLSGPRLNSAQRRTMIKMAEQDGKAVYHNNGKIFDPLDFTDEGVETVPQVKEPGAIARVRALPGEFQPKRFESEKFDEEIAKIKSGESFGQTFTTTGDVWTPGEKKMDLVSLASVNVPLAELNRSAVESALRSYQDLLDEPNITAGLFKFEQDGKQMVSIDLNAVVPQKFRANTTGFAKSNDQVSIWDAAKQEEVKTGGEGRTKLNRIGELLDALDLLTAGKPADADQIKSDYTSGGVAETGNLPGVESGRPYDAGLVGSLNRAEMEQHFPEAIIPRRKGGKEPLITSDITESPLYKEAGSRDEAVTLFKNRMVEFAKKWRDHPMWKAGASWYSEFSPKLHKHFGEWAQQFGELLAASSPQTNPQVNFGYAYDALRSWQEGRFDKQITKFNEGLEKLTDGSLEDWWNAQLKKGKIKDPPENPSPATYLADWVELNDLKPKQTNGKLYGQHSDALLQVFTRQWLERSAGPKTQNFLTNLLGTGHRATIDLWADRTMRRLGYEQEGGRWRILPKNQAGVRDVDFAFAQDVFDAAAKELGMKGDDLQGALWFAEKSLYAENGWGSLDLGDYRKEMEKLPYLEQGFRQRLSATKKKTKKVETQEEFSLVSPRDLK